MDFLSLGPMLAQGTPGAPDAVPARLASEFFNQQVETSLAMAALLLVSGIIIQVLAYWIAARVVVGNETATLARAAQLWLLFLLVGIGLGLLLAVGLIVAGVAHNPAVAVVVTAGWLLLVLALGLLLPAKVFETGLLRSLGILLLAFVLVFAAQTALNRVLGRPSFVRWGTLRQWISGSSERRQQRLKDLIEGTNTAAIEDELDRLSLPAEKAKSYPERQADVRGLAALIDARRKALRAGDKAGAANYDALRQRCAALARTLTADRGSTSPQPSAPR